MIMFQTFVDKVQAGLAKHFDSGYEIKKSEVVKNNGVACCGISIQAPESNLAPTIYMEELYRTYLDGVPLAEIVRRVIGLYEKYRIDGDFDTGMFADFDRMREKLLCRLVNYKENEEMLREVPHIRYLDMAVVFYCRIEHPRMGWMTVLVKNPLRSLWKVEESRLFRLGIENTLRQMPAEIIDIRRIFRLPEESFDPGEASYLYVLTNRQNWYGAVCMLYPNVLQNFARQIDRDVYIFPSSVHEALLAPVSECLEPENFSGMIREINATQVDAQEVLSDHAYVYDRRKKKILSIK